METDIADIRVNMASREDIAKLDTKIDILTHRILAQDGEIQLLKKVR